MSASFQTLSFRTETSQPRTSEVLFLTQRLQAAQIDTQRHQKELTESLHREHITRLRPSNTTETITIHTVTKTLHTDQSLQQKEMKTVQILHIMQTDSQTTRQLPI